MAKETRNQGRSMALQLGKGMMQKTNDKWHV